MAKIAEEFYNIEKLVGVENFQKWKFQVRILFKANDVLIGNRKYRRMK